MLFLQQFLKGMRSPWYAVNEKGGGGAVILGRIYMVGRTQNCTKILFFSDVFITSIRILRSRVVINYVCVYQKVRVLYGKWEPKFDVL